MVKVVIGFLILTAQGALAQTGDLSVQLIELRSKVQMVADQLDAQKKSLNASIQSLTVEKGEMESRKKLLLLQNKEMKRVLTQKEKIMGGKEIKGFKGYAAIVDSGSDSLLDYFKTAIPFQVKSRTEKLLKLKDKFKNKDITVAEYFEKYWSMVQDEIRLSGSVEIQNDQIQIGEKEYQVKVLKFGMYQMYFKTYEDKLGYAVNEGDHWSFHFFDDSGLEKGVDLLFLAKEKQIKGGNFKLPIVQHKTLPVLTEKSDVTSTKESENVL